jgi:hypothetical protein
MKTPHSLIVAMLHRPEHEFCDLAVGQTLKHTPPPCRTSPSNLSVENHLYQLLVPVEVVQALCVLVLRVRLWCDEVLRELAIIACA